jgi:GNAT superfamily N-acetyltransferase
VARISVSQAFKEPTLTLSLPLLVRLATAVDLDTTVLILRDCITAMREAGIDQWDDVYPTRATLFSDIREGTLYAAFLDAATLAGVVVLNEYQNPEYAQVPWTFDSGRVLVVHRLMIAPSCQRRGIARALMAFAEDRAREFGYGAIRLDAFTENPGALRLYQTLGYHDAGGVTFRKGPFRCFEKSLEGAR